MGVYDAVPAEARAGFTTIPNTDMPNFSVWSTRAKAGFYDGRHSLPSGVSKGTPFLPVPPNHFDARPTMKQYAQRSTSM
jgi:hypothetical protein